jgi:hypothetical protein
MKTATKIPTAISGELWQWAEESRRGRYLPSSTASRSGRQTSQMAQGIFARLKEILRASVTR